MDDLDDQDFEFGVDDRLAGPVIDLEVVEPPWEPPGWLATALGAMLWVLIHGLGQRVLWPLLKFSARRSWALACALWSKALAELRRRQKTWA